MKLLIAGYYELKESLNSASISLKKYGIEVIDYPLYRYYMDINDRRDDYVNHFINFLSDEKPDVILWWYIGIPSDDIGRIVFSNDQIKHIMFNWDDPYNWKTNDLENKSKYFDCVFVTCKETLKDYLLNGAGEAYHCLPGYDPEIHHMILENDDQMTDYQCDISICCTNLYLGENYPDQYMNRKEIIDLIYEKQDEFGYKFNIYGPEFLKKIYPKSYKNFVCYNDTNNIFNYSKINLCTHVKCDKDGYLNERSILILGSGGLLYVDPVKGIDQILDTHNECVILKKDHIIEQITSILSNYDDYYKVRYNGYLKSKMYTWDQWAKNLYDNYLFRFF